NSVTSVAPAMRQRQVIFTEAGGGRVPVIYDPSTTVGSTRTPFANGTIPQSQIDPVALALLQRYPLPTASGTSNNYSRTADEIDDQDQWDVRIDHRINNADQVFGRLTHFLEDATPVTAFPDGSGALAANSIAVWPQNSSNWPFA